MKKNVTVLCLFLFSVVILISCGGDKSNEARKMNPKLDSLISSMAACDQQNTNCPAYVTASEQIPLMAKDTNIKNLVDDLFNAIAQSTSSPRSAACAHAINFWAYDSESFKNAEYGRIIYDALKKEVYTDASYVGSTLGQLLSNWLVINDELLIKDIHSLIISKDTEKRGRKELIRLSGKESFSNQGLIDILINIANDNKEAEDVRVACLNVLWRAEENSQYKKVEDMYLGFVSNANNSPTIIGSSIEGLGYMKSVNGYNVILKTAEELGAKEEFCSSVSRSLSNYISYEEKEGIDKKKAFDVCVKFVNNKDIKPSYRSYYIYSVESFGGKEALAVLKKLSESNDKEIADPAKQAMERVKNKI